MTNSTLKIGVLGAYRHRNFGDQLLFNILYRWVKEYCPTARIVVPWGNSAIDWPSDEIQVGGEWEALGSCDLAIFGGGGYFGEPGDRAKRSPEHYTRVDKMGMALHLPQKLGGIYFGTNGYLRAETLRFWHLSRVAKRLYSRKIPYCIIGTGLGPVTTGSGRRSVAAVLKKAECVALRDSESVEYAKELYDRPDYLATADLALSDCVTVKSNKECHLAIHLGPRFAQHIDLNCIIEAINEIYHTLGLIQIVTDCLPQGNHIQSTMDKIAAHCQGKIKILKYTGAKKLMKHIRELDIVLTSKLHLGIVAYSRGVFPVSIAEHIKTKRFYRQVGLEEYCFDLTPKGVKKSLQCIKQIISNPSLRADLLNNRRQNIMSMALENKELLHQFLRKYSRKR